MRNFHTNDIIKHWSYLAPIIHEPKNKMDYEQLTQLLDNLLDIVGDNESHQLMGLIDVISHMINLYDESEVFFDYGSGLDALKFFMQQHQLKQTDLSDIASPGVLSEVLNGKRQNNL